MSSPKAFRCLLVCMAVLVVAAWAVWLLTRDSLPPDLKLYLNSRHSEIVSGGPSPLLLLFLIVLLMVSLVGLYCFWRPARTLYCGCLLVGVVQAVHLGPRVTTGWVAALDEVLSILSGVVLYMAFFSPVRERFGRKLDRNGVS